MPRPEAIIIRTAGTFFVVAAVLEGLGRLRHSPTLHEAAAWALVAGLFVVLIPIAAVAVILMFQAVFLRRKSRNGA